MSSSLRQRNKSTQKPTSTLHVASETSSSRRRATCCFNSRIWRASIKRALDFEKFIPLVNYTKKTRDECLEILQRPFIHNGYLDLTEIESLRQSVSTAFLSIHNETGNIYTHLLPAIFCLFYCILAWSYINLTRDVLLATFKTSMVAMLCFSTCYHTIRCTYPNHTQCGLTLDLVGIWALVTGSFLPGIYIGFECHSTLQFWYLTFVIMYLGICIPTMWFIIPHMFSWEVRVFAMVAAVGSGVIPSIHWMLLEDPEFLSFVWWGPVGMFFFYFVGFAIWHFCIPERWWPGLFDTWGHSHQIWHVCVLTAGLFWWLALDVMAQKRNELAC